MIESLSCGFFAYFFFHFFVHDGTFYFCAFACCCCEGNAWRVVGFGIEFLAS